MSINSHLIKQLGKLNENHYIFLLTTILNHQLAHKIPDIRLRALDDLEKKMYNTQTVSNAPEILKALIKWFSNKPIQREVSVMKLLQFVLAVG